MASSNHLIGTNLSRCVTTRICQTDLPLPLEADWQTPTSSSVGPGARQVGASSIEGKSVRILTGPIFNVCTFQVTAATCIGCGCSDTAATGALADSRLGEPSVDVDLIPPDIIAPTATAATNPKYAGALLTDMVSRLLSS